MAENGGTEVPAGLTFGLAVLGDTGVEGTDAVGPATGFDCGAKEVGAAGEADIDGCDAGLALGSWELGAEGEVVADGIDSEGAVAGLRWGLLDVGEAGEVDIDGSAAGFTFGT